MNPVTRLVEALVEEAGGNPYLAALIGSSIAALLTSLGGLSAVLLGPPRRHEDYERFINVALTFSSGVMIVASFTSLLIPSLESYGFKLTIFGFILGALTIHVLNNAIPHEHFIKGYEGPKGLGSKLRAAWLVALAILIHNIPEGMSIGAASAYDVRNGIRLAVAIGVQDFPEGAAVAFPILLAGGKRRVALAIAILSGLSEVIAAVPTTLLAGFSSLLLPVLMGFGAGAMVYVVSNESLPEAYRTGKDTLATVGFFLGFIVMLALDVLLG